MKKAPSRAIDIRPDGDKAKRVYRTAVETSQRLEEISKQKKAYREVFMPDAINLRSRLQDYCEKLMFYDPLEYGRKAEELLWRKVYYDVIQLMKHNRKQMRPSSSLESAFRTHLAAATGYYHHLLCKIQSEYQLGLEGVIDFYYISDNKTYQRGHAARKVETEPKVKQWALRACHRCLIYLGDLARYQQDYDGMRSRVMSQRYYFQALALFPNLGMPHNQLGTLAGSRYYNVDAVYYYMRCLVTTSPFEGAHGNLMRLLEKNRHYYHDINNTSTRDLPPEQQRSKDIKRLMVRFMYLLDILHSKNTGVSSKSIQENCQNTLRDFELCMFYQPPHVTQPADTHHSYANDEHTLYIEDEMLIKIVIICIMSIYLLQKESNKKVTAAIAFSLALFSHILNHVMIRLQTALYELENPRKVLKVDSSDVKTNEEKKVSDPEGDAAANCAPSTPSDVSTVEEEGKDKQNEKTNETSKGGSQKKHKLKKLRQRRKRRHASGGSQTSSQGAAPSDESDLSEGGGGVDMSASDSEPDEELQYLNRFESSDSDSDDRLMISQELRSGFATQGKDQLSQGLNSVPELEEEHDDHGNGQGHREQQHHAVSGSLSAGATLNSMQSNDDKISDIVSSSDQKENLATNVREYLKEFPVDGLDSSSFLSETLKFPALVRDDQQAADAQIKAIAQGKKEVRVPPGFEKSVESHHVSEITRKMASFVIETDTDITQTDTDYSALTTESEMETETETEQENPFDKKKLEEQHLENTLKVITNEGLLCSIKLYCDWLQCNPHIIATCAKSLQSLWSRLSVLLNFLPLEKDLHKMEVCQSSTLMKMVAEAASSDWNPTEPLHEDMHLRQFVPLEDVQKELLFDTQSRRDLSKEQEAVLRILYLRRFGHYISKMKSVSFTYNAEKSMFYGPRQQISQSAPEESNNKNMVDAEARRNQLMKDMAQLRLQAEVSQLEGTLQSRDQVNLPPYLVPDATALCETLNLVKQLANSARFIITIPVVVIDHLDVLKKECSTARDCIRWLEAEIKKGNRYIRHQKSHEKTCNLPLKNLKKKDRDAWRFVQIVDCAKYLSQQSSDCDPHGMICILTKFKVTSNDISPRLKQALISAQQEGIAVQSAVEFHAKWKDVWQAGKG